MKKLDDDEIQKLLEQDLTVNMPLTDTDDDFKTYKVLFDALKTEPEGGLPYNFAADIGREVRQRRDDSKDLKLYVLLGVAVLIGFAGVCVYIVHTYSKGMQLMASSAKPYLWIFIFCMACLLISQYLDQKLIKSPALGDRVEEK